MEAILWNMTRFNNIELWQEAVLTRQSAELFVASFLRKRLNFTQNQSNYLFIVKDYFL